MILPLDLREFFTALLNFFTGFISFPCLIFFAFIYSKDNTFIYSKTKSILEFKHFLFYWTILIKTLLQHIPLHALLSERTSNSNIHSRSLQNRFSAVLAQISQTPVLGVRSPVTYSQHQMASPSSLTRADFTPSAQAGTPSIIRGYRSGGHHLWWVVELPAVPYGRRFSLLTL